MNYSSNIILTPYENNRFQTIYASQSYGTFYSIYARFTMIDILDENFQVVPGKKLMQQIDLKLINYKGLVNIEFTGTPEIDPNAQELNSETQTILLKINVKGSVTHTPKTQEIVNIVEPFEVTNESSFTVVRELVSLSGHSKGSNEMKSSVGGVFDNEFFYRDGLLQRRKEIVGFPLSTEINGAPGYDFNTFIDLNLPGKRCIIGQSKISI